MKVIAKRKFCSTFRWILILWGICFYVVYLLWWKGFITPKDEEHLDVLQQNFEDKEKAGKRWSLTLTLPRVYAERNAELRRHCERKEKQYKGIYPDTNLRNRLYLDRRNGLMYCSIEKVACTVLKRILLITSGKANFSSPFQIPPYEAHYRPLDSLGGADLDDAILMHHTFLKFLFTRDPYTKLFSGYVDKLFTFQVPFQTSVGSSIIRSYRRHPSASSLKCGHDVKFSEFIQYIISYTEAKAHKNLHFAEMYEQCRPCHLQYDIIGKLETFQDDLRFILEQVGKSSLIPPDSFKEDVARDNLWDAVHIGFSNKPTKSQCFTFHDVLHRVWRRMQIRGFISKTFSFPIEKSKTASVSKKEFFNVLMSAWRKSRNEKSTKNNKMEAMIEAYSSVPSENMERLRKVLLPDCLLFGYNPKPRHLFKRRNGRNHSFIYFDLI